MQVIHLKKQFDPPQIEGVIVTELSNSFFCDFSGLPNSGPDKRDFIANHVSEINYDEQKPLSVAAHSIAGRSNAFEISNIIHSTTLESLIGEATGDYSTYKTFSFDNESCSFAIDTNEPIQNLPVPKEIIAIEPNYFSFVLLHGLKDIYGSSAEVTFHCLQDLVTLDDRVLGFKIVGNDLTGFYNTSYKPPFNPLALI